MKSKAPWIKVVLLLLYLICFFTYTALTWAETKPEMGYLENLTLEKLAAKERVTIQVSRQSGVNVESLSARSVGVRLDNVFLPEEWKKTVGEGQLNNIVRIVPTMKSGDGKSWTVLTIDLKERVPYSVKQEGNSIHIDFNVSALAHREAPFVTPAAADARKAAGKEGPVAMGGADKAGAARAQNSANPKITVDFQDADIRAILRLLSEQSGRNIVAAPEVKGNMTISMKNVPWEQILDTILKINGLEKKEEGNVITVKTVAAVEKEERERRTIEESRVKFEESRVKNEEMLRLAKKKSQAERGKAMQIMIEAKILEVTDGFTRTLGVQWSGAYLGGNSDYRYGLIGGTSSQTTPITKLTSGLALTRDALALDFPASATALAPSFGVIMGGSNAILQARISAMETTSTGKIISSPRVLISDEEKAVIEQGEQIPVVTPATANNPATVTYKDAVLKLEVTPLIIPDDYVLMTILARNDRPNWAQKDPATGNVPIFTSKVDSKVAVKDGDTIVIGGIRKSDDEKAVGGVPWLYKIPILGWLFKTEDIIQAKTELLIVVTPRIIRKADTPETIPATLKGG